MDWVSWPEKDGIFKRADGIRSSGRKDKRGEGKGMAPGDNFFLPQTQAGSRLQRDDLPPPHYLAFRALETSFAPGSSPGQAGVGRLTRPVFVWQGKKFLFGFVPVNRWQRYC